MAFCSKCGTKLNDGAVFCSKCGNNLSTGAVTGASTITSAKPNGRKWSKMKTVLIAIVSVIVLGVAGVLVSDAININNLKKELASTPYGQGETISFGAYQWRVLERQGNRALIISETFIGEGPYHADRDYAEEHGITWAESDIRADLHLWVVANFTDDELGRIIQVTNRNPDNSYYGTKGGEDTHDYIFLLNEDEFLKYFGESSKILANHIVLWNWEKAFKIYCDHYEESSYNRSRDSVSWLRSPGENIDRAATVYAGRNVFLRGSNVYDNNGIRPALWINL